MNKHSAAIARRMYWSNQVQRPWRCPECKKPLEQEHHSYMMAVRHKGTIDPFVTGNDGGRFCASCPVVVLDHECFSEAAAVGAGTGKGVEFMVLGIVDLDAVPTEKKHIPFDDDTNPLPLVKFTNLTAT